MPRRTHASNLRPRPTTTQPRHPAALRVEMLEHRLVPAVFPVSNLDDTGAGSLRAAIDAANGSPGADQITFDVTGGGTITLATPDTTHPNDFGPTAFVITDPVTITGPTDAGVALDGGGTLRMFAVSAAGALTLQNLTLQNGTAQGGDGGDGGPGGGGAGLGGAIFNAGSVTIENCLLVGNSAVGGNGGDGVAVANVGGGGGGSAGFGGGATGSQTGGAGGGGLAGAGATGGAGTGGEGGAGVTGVQAAAGVAGTAGGGGGGANTVGAGADGTDPSPLSGFGGGGGGGSAGVTGGGGAGGAGGFAAGGGGGGGAGGLSGAGGAGGPGGFGGGGGAGNDGAGSSAGGVGGAGGAFAGSGSDGTSAGIGGGGGGAGLGGAIFNNTGAHLTVLNSTFSGNTAQGGAGGARAGSSVGGGGGSGMGGAVFNRAGTVTLTNTTVADSTVTAGTASSGVVAGSADGAIYNFSDASGDAALTLISTLVAGTTGGSDVHNDQTAGTATVDATAGDLVQSGVSGTGAINAGGLLTGDPQLGQLADNGGPTRTYALSAGSPALDAGGATAPSATDQRGAGFNRLIGGAVDIGAFEYQPPATTTALVVSPSPAAVGVPVTLTATVAGVAAGSNTPQGDVTFSDGATPLATVPLTGGVASFTITTPLGVGTHTITAAYSGSSSPGLTFDASQDAKSLAVFQAPAITSGTGAAFAVGAAGSFTITATGSPVPSLTESGPLPAGVTFTDNGDGTATLTGTPAAGTRGTYPLTITATNGTGTDATQAFTLTVSGTPGAVDQGQVSPFAVSGGPAVTPLNPDGSGFGLSIDPFGTTPTRAVLADVTGDGTPDLVIGAGPGGSQVVVIDGATRQTVSTFTPFGSGFTGGTFVAAGDVDGDGRADIAVSADTTGGPRVVVFDGRTGDTLADFFAIADPDFRGGARVALGDLNGDGRADLAVAAGPGGGPRVALYDGATIRAGAVPTRLVNDFFVFEPALRDGAYVAIGDVTGDGFGDLVAGAGAGGSPRILVLSGQVLLTGGAAAAVDAPVANFFAAPAGIDGARVAAKDLDGDNLADVVVAVPADSGREVLAFRGADLVAQGQPPVFEDYSDSFDPALGGVFVG